MPRDKDIEKSDADKAIIQEKIKAHEDLKASAKAKLINGEPLTEAEANTIVFNKNK